MSYKLVSGFFCEPLVLLVKFAYDLWYYDNNYREATLYNYNSFDLNRVLLTVEAENKLSPGVAGEVRITQVSCVSPSWSITKTDRGQGA